MSADVGLCLERARVAKDAQVIVVALARATQVYVEMGRPDDARRLFDELLEFDVAPFRYAFFTLGDVAWAATRIGRADAARRALTGVDWPSFRAARAIVDGDFARAAAIYDEVGAARSAAMARLHGGLDDGAREFFARVGFTRYAELAVVPST